MSLDEGGPVDLVDLGVSRRKVAVGELARERSAELVVYREAGTVASRENDEIDIAENELGDDGPRGRG